MKQLLLLIALLALPAQAAEKPLDYVRKTVRILPSNATAGAEGITFDTEIRDAASAARTPGWYNFASPDNNKAAMMSYEEPTITTLKANKDYAPMDVLFVDAYGTIRQILPGLVIAELQDPISSSDPVMAVIYLRGGTVNHKNIQPGDQVEFSLFRKKPVVLNAPSAGAPAMPAAPGAPAAPDTPAVPAEAAAPPEPLAQQAAPAIAVEAQPVITSDTETLPPQLRRNTGPLMVVTQPVKLPAAATPAQAGITVTAPERQDARQAEAVSASSSSSSGGAPSAEQLKREREILIDRVLQQNTTR